MKNDHPNGQPAPASRTVTADAPALAESLRRFRNQSPSESLGLPAGGSLTKPFIQASIVTAVLFALLTVLPYLMDQPQKADTKVNAPASDKQEPGDTPKPPGPESPAKTMPGTKTDAKGDIVSKLNENATKTAPAKVNPLDKKDDDILKDIK